MVLPGSVPRAGRWNTGTAHTLSGVQALEALLRLKPRLVSSETHLRSLFGLVCFRLVPPGPYRLRQKTRAEKAWWGDDVACSVSMDSSACRKEERGKDVGGIGHFCNRVWYSTKGDLFL